MSSFFASIGANLLQFSFDEGSFALRQTGQLQMPSSVQYAYRHAQMPVLYVSCADLSAPSTPGRHFLCAVAVDDLGGLELLGEPVVVAQRAIHITTDMTSRHLVAAYNEPPGLTVHRLGPDGRIGPELPGARQVRLGPFPHHVRVAPSDACIIVAARGYEAADAKGPVPGALNVLSYDDGAVENVRGIFLAGQGDFGTFQARCLDFHPTLPLIYLSIESQNKMAVLGFDGVECDLDPLFSRDTLLDPANTRPRQLAAEIHVHPSGQYVYVANRAEAPEGFTGGTGPLPSTDELPIFQGGENSISTFRIDPVTGEPTLIQSIDTQGIAPKTFSIDPSGRGVVVANRRSMKVRDGEDVRTVSANLAIFRIIADGSLVFERKYDFDVGRSLMDWSGFF